MIKENLKKNVQNLFPCLTKAPETTLKNVLTFAKSKSLYSICCEYLAQTRDYQSQNETILDMC